MRDVKPLSDRLYWCFVAFALLMMIGSAGVSLFLIAHNNEQSGSLAMRSGQIEQTIREIWHNTAMQQQELYLSAILKTGHSDIEIADLEAALKNRRKQADDRINTLYLEKIKLDREINKFNEQNLLFTGLAVIMQLVSFTIITLTRDIERKPHILNSPGGRKISRRRLRTARPRP